MEEKKTHEVILHAALIQFSEHGFAAVSMRNIAEAAGIRASSIYHHFKGKQELFNELVEQANVLKDQMRVSFLNAFEKITEIEEEAFINAGLYFLTGFLQNDYVAPLLQVLETERFHNTEADRAWQELMFLAPIEHETAVFSKMYERGMVRDSDVAALASEYQAAVLFAYFGKNEVQLRYQLQRFYKRYIG